VSRAVKRLDIGLIGATGAVGAEFLKILEERQFPLASLKLLASERSIGRKLFFNHEELPVEVTTSQSIAGLDIVFISATTAVSKEYAALVAKAGGIAIDDSSAWRMDPEVPLVVPEVNRADLENHKGIISTPNCTTVPMVMALSPLHNVNPIKRIVVSTYQAVSGTGRAAVEELSSQARTVLEGKSSVPHIYPHQIAFNVLPEVEVFMDSGYTREEWKMSEETKKIMHAPELLISATCVRVPVYVGHSEALHVEFSNPMAPDEARRILSGSAGVRVLDDPSVSLYPHAWAAAGTDDVLVGRIRQDVSHPNSLAMWLVVDNLRKGAALNAIQIAEELVKMDLVRSPRPTAARGT